MSDSYLLSADEKEVVTDTEWVLAKHRIIKKVYFLFGELSQHYGSVLHAHARLPDEVTTVSAKIYKGENYLMFPYVMLDHPRYFNKSDVFAVRTLFWWGDSFSIHLVLGGKYKTALMSILKKKISSLHGQDWYFTFTNHPWDHHFEPPNYQALEPDSALSETADNYFKLGRRLKLDQWDGAKEFFVSSFEQLVSLVH